MKTVNIEVRDKFIIEGFRSSEPKLYKGITKMYKAPNETLLYIGEKCVACIDNFYQVMTRV